MGFHSVSVKQSVSTEADRGLILLDTKENNTLGNHPSSECEI
jgi:hypothetical protein